MQSSGFGVRSKNRIIGSDRGVALIIVLLVTALLIALIFEFAYGTRVSLRAAANFRDSQRAYFLARSGVNFAGALLSDNLKNGKLQDNLEQREWQVVPLIPGGDTELRVRWEDESGKINIGILTSGSDGNKRLGGLFEVRRISTDVLKQIAEWQQREIRKFYLVTELHQFLSDEEFRKVQDAVTTSLVSKININTASTDVIQSGGVRASAAESIVEQRNGEPCTKDADIGDYLKKFTSDYLAVQDAFKCTSDVFKVNSFATVGGYTKQVEAVITRSTTGYTISYWRAL